MSGTQNLGYDPSWQVTLDDLTTTFTNAAFPNPTVASHSLPACEKCCRTFSTEGDLEKHRDAHTRGEVQYWCIPQCGRGYTTGAELQTHQAQCQEIVAVRYFDPTFMPDPIVDVPNHSPSAGTTDTDTTAAQESSGSKRRWHMCQCCSRGFKTRAMLVEHLAIHESGMRIICPAPGCGKAYATSRDLKAHQTISGCCGPQPPSGSAAQAFDAPSERQSDYRQPRSDSARHSARASSSAGTPGVNMGVVKPLFHTDSGGRVLQDWQCQELENSYRKSAYPAAEEVRRLQQELWLAQDVVRRWFMSRRRESQ